ncbi:MAG: class I SAM-dependent methyltransferase [Candidatus Omnitrophica bacterium]|nr:class I SAM-dependent methyltransferase [Candidatus Omnitrophota bacterium]MDD5660904.1 class I SAM-dependent methyltransferase [Candidatus Omnitrophota bacterium]
MGKINLPARAYAQYRAFRIKLAKVKASIYDQALGIETAEEDPIQSVVNSFNSDRYGYQSAFYGRLEKIIKYLKPSSEDVFVDLGCGKGRVVFFVALKRFKKVIGVELDQGLYAIAQENLRRLRIQRSPIELFNIDAANFEAKDATIFFMFNPFGAKTLENVLNNIKKSLAENPRKIRIVYYCPYHRSLLDKQDWLLRDGQIENDICLAWSNKY